MEIKNVEAVRRFDLVKAFSEVTDAKIMAVGDDWQSIYSFAGSKIEYIYRFCDYFSGAKLFKITNTYRNSQSLIDYSGAFIMKNKDQIKKELTSNKDIKNPKCASAYVYSQNRQIFVRRR